MSFRKSSSSESNQNMNSFRSGRPEITVVDLMTRLPRTDPRGVDDSLLKRTLPTGGVLVR